MKFLTDFTYRNLHGFEQFPSDSTALVLLAEVTKMFFDYDSVTTNSSKTVEATG